MPIDILIEGLLFYKSAPQKKRVIMKLFAVSEADLDEALTILKERLKNGAIRLIDSGEEVQLAAAPELSPIIEALRKNELKSDIGRAGAETLAIILYQGPVTRTDIDRIRGVNSSFILRNLMIRGLVSREHNTKLGRYEFKPSTTLLSHLGITSKESLPDFARINDALEVFTQKANKPNEIPA
jgi:segregation and condensation protein B